MENDYKNRCKNCIFLIKQDNKYFCFIREKECKDIEKCIDDNK